jgi:hypothetical protein
LSIALADLLARFLCQLFAATSQDNLVRLVDEPTQNTIADAFIRASYDDAS